MDGWDIRKTLEAFRGAGIDKIALNKAKDRLYLIDTEGRIHLFETEGDCCSSSWIENIEFLGNALRQPITEITAETDGILFRAVGEDYEHSQLLDYSTTFHTASGRMKIEYRNESNGYYGGSMNYAGLVPMLPDDINFLTGDT